MLLNVLPGDVCLIASSLSFFRGSKKLRSLSRQAACNMCSTAAASPWGSRCGTGCNPAGAGAATPFCACGSGSGCTSCAGPAAPGLSTAFYALFPAFCHLFPL